MSTDLDPITVLARTDPAADLSVPEPPALDELASLPASVGPEGGRAGRAGGAGGAGGVDGSRSRRPVLAAAVVLVAVLTAAAVLAARAATEERTEVPAATTGTATTAEPSSTTEPRATTEPGTTVEDPTDTTLDPVRLPLGAAEPAGDRLLDLADAVAGDDRPRPDRVAYARGVGWTAEAGADGEVRFRGSQVETWSVPGEPRTYRAGIVELRSAGADGRANPTLPRPSLTVDLATTSMVDPGSWERPGSVAEVRNELAGVDGDATGPESALTTATAILSRPTTGPERATLFRALAQVEGIEHRGTVTDRMGRPSVALSVSTVRESLPAELVVLLDPATGELLASETVYLPTSADEQPIVVQATTTVEVAWVDEVGVRPEG